MKKRDRSLRSRRAKRTSRYWLEQVYREGRLAGKYGDVYVTRGCEETRGGCASDDLDTSWAPFAASGAPRSRSRVAVARRRATHQTFAPSAFEAHAAPTHETDSRAPTLAPTLAPTEVPKLLVVTSSVVFATTGDVSPASWSSVDDAIFRLAVQRAVKTVTNETQLSNQVATLTSVTFDVTLRYLDDDTEIWSLVSAFMAELAQACTTDSATGATPLDAAIAWAKGEIGSPTLYAAVDSATSLAAIYAETTYTWDQDPNAVHSEGSDGSEDVEVPSFAYYLMSFGFFFICFCCLRWYRIQSRPSRGR